MWMSIFTWLLSALALLGNGLVIYLLVVRKRLHSSANAFITSLAFADFFVGLFTMPCYRMTSVFSGYRSVRLLTSFRYFLFYTSASNLCVVTADRFVAVACPLSYITFMTWRRVFSFIFVAWLTPFTVCFLPVTWIYSSSVETQKICNKVFVAFLLTFFEFLPCIVMVNTTWRLLCISRRHTRQTLALQSQLKFNHPTLNFSSLREHRERNISSAKLISVVVALFVFCYTSEMISSLFHLLNLHKNIWRNYFKNDGRFLFLITNSAVNPFVYALLKKDIQNEFRRFFSRKRFRWWDLMSYYNVPPLYLPTQRFEIHALRITHILDGNFL